MHFVGLAFQPIEKPPHSIPQPVLPQFFTGHTRTFSFQHPALVGFIQFLKGRTNIQPAFPRTPQQVTLTFLPVLRLEWFDHTRLQTQSTVRYRSVKVDLDGPTKPSTFGTRTNRMIETK
jgi:hypothetical protein